MSKPSRPLSPHLQVYRLQLHMLMSGLHRISGLALGFGAILLTWWAVALAASKEYYEFLTGLLAHPIGRLVLFAFSLALVYHMLTGIRHLIWDTGRGFDKKTVSKNGPVILVLAVVITVGIWVLAYAQAGKL